MAQGKQPFATVEIRNSERLNRQLRDALLEISESLPSRKTNAPDARPVFRNKWLSSPDLHQSETPVFRELARLVENLSNRSVVRRGTDRPLAIVSMWGVVSRPEMEARRHNHGDSVSAVYYVDAGSSGEADGGILQFFEDGGQPGPSHVVVPRSGLLVIFPSRLPHAVSSYSGEAPRIIVAATMN